MIGDRLGKWVIFKELGRGGMGRVYLAQEELTGKQAAIKVLSAQLAQDIGFLQRFQREIETLAKLDHPNIVRFYEAGFENGLYFYAMEYVEGMSLEQIIEEQSRLPWNDVLEIALQVTPALRHVHDNGVIHRDIKPSNLILNRDGQIKLMDFGIAKVFAATHLTATGGIVGTAEYISPEQAAGKVVGKRSDLYCFGCVLYALIVGRPPFMGNSYVELLHKHRYGQFDPPHKFMADMPYELDELICQMLEKDPDKRPRDALVVFKTLDSIRAKIDRQSHRTSVDNRNAATVAENRTDKVSVEALPSPATLMSRLVRAELETQQRGGPVNRFLNRPTVLVALLLACVGILVWTFWPLSAAQLYERGAKLMESESAYDMERAWREYLGPLERDYPDHGYKEELEAFRVKWQTAKSPQASEAQRFFLQAEMLQKQGNQVAAQKMWKNVIDVFDGVAAEKVWVDRARRALNDQEKAGLHKDRLKNVEAALKNACQLRDCGQRAEADRILCGIIELYENDPAAAELVAEAKKMRPK